MGLFDKKECSVCGEKIGLLGNRKLEDGNLCKHCARKLSPWFDERRHSTVEQIKAQLAYREENQRELASFSPNTVIGEYYKMHVEMRDGKPYRFVVSASNNYKEDNADIVKFSQVRSCRTDIKENRTELKYTNSKNERVSYNPPRYEYSYDFYMIIEVECPYFDDMRFKLNSRNINLVTNEQSSGFRLFNSMNFDPMHYPEYREFNAMCDSIVELCSGRYAATAGTMSGMPSYWPEVVPLLDAVRNAPTHEAMIKAFQEYTQRTINYPDLELLKQHGVQALHEGEMRLTEQSISGNRTSVGAMGSVGNNTTPPGVVQSAPSAAPTWTCPSCGSETSGKFCRECGTKKPEASVPSTWKCSCGTTNSGKFCMECGARFNG